MIDTFVLSQLAIGVSVGMTYSIVAIGLTLIYRVLSAVNFARGEASHARRVRDLIAATTLELPLWAIVPLALLVGAAFRLERRARGIPAVSQVHRRSVVEVARRSRGHDAAVVVRRSGWWFARSWTGSITASGWRSRRSTS